MAVTKDLSETKKEGTRPEELSVIRYEELKEKLKRKMLRKIREDQINRDTSKVHEI